MITQKLEQAKQLIKEKRYLEARRVLETIPHDPTAVKWLARLDQIAPIEEQPSFDSLYTQLAAEISYAVDTPTNSQHLDPERISDLNKAAKEQSRLLMQLSQQLYESAQLQKARAKLWSDFLQNTVVAAITAAAINLAYLLMNGYGGAYSSSMMLEYAFGLAHGIGSNASEPLFAVVSQYLIIFSISWLLTNVMAFQRYKKQIEDM